MNFLNLQKHILIVAVLVILSLILAGCSEKEDTSAISRPVVTNVTIKPVTLSSVAEVIEITGIVRSDRQSVIAARMLGQVAGIFVREGDAVKAGQLLLTLENREVAERARGAALAVETARQNLTLAETTWQRYKNLYEDKALTKQEMDMVETQKKVAQTEYQRAKTMAEEAKTYQNYTHVTAPFSGRVTEKRIDAGSMASPGMPLLVIEALGDFYIEAATDESLRNKIQTGAPVQIMVDALKQNYEGKVSTVIPTIDPLSRTFKIKVQIQEKNLSSGLFVRLRIPTGKKEALLAPETALARKGQLTGVYVVNKQGEISYRLVREGVAYPEGREILSGLSPQEKIIVAGIERAIDGGIVFEGGGK